MIGQHEYSIRHCHRCQTTTEHWRLQDSPLVSGPYVSERPWTCCNSGEHNDPELLKRLGVEDDQLDGSSRYATTGITLAALTPKPR